MSEGGKRRIHTPTGRYYDDFAVGDIYEHRPGRTITEADNINFSLMTMNQHPMHCDANFAAKSEFKRPLVNSGLTLAALLGLSALSAGEIRLHRRVILLEGTVAILIAGFCLAVMLPATFCAGMTLPLVTRVLFTRQRSERVVGRVYALNTLGSIVGAALAALVRTDQDHAKQINAQLGALNNLLALPSDQRDDQTVRAISAAIETLRVERKAARQPFRGTRD